MADSPREPAMDARSLYREEIYTDRRMGTLRVMVPVTPEGADDGARPTVYVGEAQLMTNMGPLPISFDIEATSLGEAVAKYGDAAKVGVAAALAFLGALAATAFLIVLLGELLDNYWLSSLIVAVVFLAIGAIMGKNAMNDLKSREVKPKRTIETLQADAQWAKREVAEVKREWKS